MKHGVSLYILSFGSQWSFGWRSSFHCSNMREVYWPWMVRRCGAIYQLYQHCFDRRTAPVLWLVAGYIWAAYDAVVSFFFRSGKAGLPDPEILVERLLKRRMFRPDPQGANLMFAFFAQHFTHQFFKTFNRMGLGFTKALSHGVSLAGACILIVVFTPFYNYMAVILSNFERIVHTE